MLSLIVDTSTTKSVLALAEKGEVIRSLDLPEGYCHSRTIIADIEQLILDFGSDKREIGSIVVAVGPGSYTGIRVGVMAGKALAFAWDVPIIGVCSLYGFVPYDDGPFVALIDARRGGAYVAKGTKDGETNTFLSSPVLCTKEELSGYIEDTGAIATPSIPNNIADAFSSVRLVERWPCPNQYARLGYDKYLRKVYSLDQHVDIMYLRKTQAEIEKACRS